MKKYLNAAFVYMLAALASGVFYREFTKYNGFTGKTTLGLSHGHLFLLGSVLLLIVALFSTVTNFEEQKNEKKFFLLHNIGLPFMVVMFYTRGILQVLGVELSKGLNSAISGVSGIAHIILGVSLFLLFSTLKKTSIKIKLK